MTADRLENDTAPRGSARTDEPQGKGREGRAGGALWFSVQKHDASSVHYDLRLEWDGVLLSWTIPKGPAPVTGERRLARRTEDHPLDYGDFEGTIPEGACGGGTVMLWGRGTWAPRGDVADMVADMLADGNPKMDVDGARMRGGWALIRFAKGGEGAWLLIKERDGEAGDDPDALTGTFGTSVASGRSMEEIARTQRVKRPKFRAPQLATLADEAPEGEGWSDRTKLDGYRALAAIGTDGPTMWTWRGHVFAAACRAGAPVAGPVTRDELESLAGEGAFDIGAIAERITEDVPGALERGRADG